MPLNIVLNDGNIPFGTQTIVLNGKLYYIENCTATKAANVVDVPNEVGAPRGQVIVGGKIEGSMTLQYIDAESTASMFSPGAKFIMTGSLAGTGSQFLSCSVTSITTPRQNNNYWTIDVGYVEIINSPANVTP